MIKKKKILFVIPYLCNGGAERALSNITTHFPENYDIDILVNSDKQVDYPFRGNIISMGIDTKKQVDSVWFQFWVLIKRIKWLRKLKKSKGYIACISFMDSANIANIVSGKKYAKILISIRASLMNAEGRAYKYIVKPIVRMIYNSADVTVAVSKELSCELEEHFGLKRVVTIENGYDFEKIREMSKTPLEEEFLNQIRGKHFIFTAGRLKNQKRQWHLIRAMRKVIEVFPNTILFVAGSGELKDYLNSLIFANGLEENVKLIGNVDNVFSFERQAELFVFPSGWEGFPNALVEAMCVGAPCIATDFRTGAREILAPELLGKEILLKGVEKCSYGMIIPLCSGEKYSDSELLEESEVFLAEAIIEMLKDKELRETYRKRSIERGKQFGIDETVKQWIAIIGD